MTQLQAEADTKGLITWEANVGSTVPGPPPCRRDGEIGHLPKEPPGGISGEPADHVYSAAHGGLTSTIHLAVEQGPKPLLIVLGGSLA
ncbi:hypothetical protein [Streptomyces sp. NRRL S-1448]|uniref:hypothetical protein n=1 Tax=Streptomyces sp. NRRL S-1448 TaxID=1463883 RepID=UPI00131E9E6F|nr:hypothetical protein [Streptomyces sp. NRRL S-1448]